MKKITFFFHIYVLAKQRRAMQFLPSNPYRRMGIIVPFWVGERLMQTLQNACPLSRVMDFFNSKFITIDLTIIIQQYGRFSVLPT